MALYEVTSSALRKINTTSFREAEIREREDLQRLLRDQIEILDDETELFVVAEEFSDWEDSKRRVDLLAIDKSANLIVIELKRTEDGGHMELQSLRYAAMISNLTFERVAEAHQRDLRRRAIDNVDATTALLEFLEWTEPQDDEFGQSVRIILASAEFSREVTTSVLWLNEQGLDIRCVRLQPYQDGDRTLIDVQQLIPLKEAEDFFVRAKEKSRKARASRKRSMDLTKYDIETGLQTFEKLSKRDTALHVVRSLINEGATPDDIVAHAPFRKNRVFYSIPKIAEHGEDFIRLAKSFATDSGKKFDPRRFHTSDEDLICLDGSTYAVSNQWGHQTYEWVTGLLDGFGDSSIVVSPSES